MDNGIFSKHLEELLAGGFNACEYAEGKQRYLEVQNLAVGSPPWNKSEVTILIAIPSNYNIGGLDGFYVEEAAALLVDGQPHPRIQGPSSILGKQWRIVSWHYADNKPWTANDTLLTHVLHCRQFFKQGARSN